MGPGVCGGVCRPGVDGTWCLWSWSSWDMVFVEMVFVCLVLVGHGVCGHGACGHGVCVPTCDTLPGYLHSRV